MTGLPRAARLLPPSTAEHPYPGRTPHWVRPNQTERIPHRWIVADTEARRVPAVDGECQTLRCAVGVRWRDDLKTGDGEEWAQFDDAGQFWRWVTGYTYGHGRTCLAFHNAAYDLRLLDAFTWLPALRYDLVWCNLDRDVSVVSWRGPGGTLVIWDTYTWTGQALDALAPLTGIAKPPLPHDGDTAETWLARCTADVAITQTVVKQLLRFIREQHLGNWQPSGAGMGHTAWRHRFYTHKVLVHDDAQALAAEREAMHAGRAEAWWHGQATGGPFTEWDMTAAYPRIAAECDVPAKLWDHDTAPSRRVHEWALEHFRVLARVLVRAGVPVVPARLGGRVSWPVGEFETVLWDTELAQLRAVGGRYKVHEQWRYTRKPVLAGWAAWSVAMMQLGPPAVSGVAQCWVKHQSRAVIGRMGLRTPTWERYSRNWLPWYTGLSWLHEAGRESRRLMHVGSYVWAESERAEAQQSVPQITSWIMAEARSRLWQATLAAGQENVLHVDTDSLIATAAGTRNLELAVAAGLPGCWRPKATWRQLGITGPRHYAAPGRRQVPGVPRAAEETEPGVFTGEVWDSLARALAEGRTGEVRVRLREWRPQRVDHRRPYQGEENGPALPITVGPGCEEAEHATTRAAEAGATQVHRSGRRRAEQPRRTA